MAFVSGYYEDMKKGGINPGVYKTGETGFAEAEARNGGTKINLVQTLTDLDGNDHPLVLFAMMKTDYESGNEIVQVNKRGQLESVGDDNVRVQFDERMGAGRYLASWGRKGFTVKALKNIGADPSGLDGQWIRIDLEPVENKKDGKTYNNVVIADLLDGPPKGAKAGNGGVAKKTAKPAVDEDEDEQGGGENEKGGETELGYSEEQIAAASQYVEELLASPGDFVKNFDSDATTLTLAQIHTPVFSKGKDIAKEHGVKVGELARVVGDPAFHRIHTDSWDDEEGTVALPKPKKSSSSAKRK